EAGAVVDLRAGGGVEPIQTGAARAHGPNGSAGHDRRSHRAHSAGTPGTGGSAARIAGAEGRRRRVDAEADDTVAFAGQIQTAVRVCDGTERRVAVDAHAYIRSGVRRSRWKELAIRAAEVRGIQQESL